MKTLFTVTCLCTRKTYPWLSIDFCPVPLFFRSMDSWLKTFSNQWHSFHIFKTFKTLLLTTDSCLATEFTLEKVVHVVLDFKDYNCHHLNHRLRTRRKHETFEIGALSCRAAERRGRKRGCEQGEYHLSEHAPWIAQNQTVRSDGLRDVIFS